MSKKVPKVFIKGKVTKRILLTLVLFSFTACADINRVRDAQQAFNEASMHESQLKLQNYSAKGGSIQAQDGVAIRAGYTSVIYSIDSLESDLIKSFESDELWGNVLVLKAMAYWRLAEYAKSLTTREKALKYKLGDRDHVMMEILPQLIENDEKLAKMNSIKGKISKDDAKKFIQSFVNSMEGIGSVGEKLPDNHPMLHYLLSTELAMYKNIKDACYRIHERYVQKVSACYQPVKCNAFKSYEKLKDISGSDGAKVIQRWGEITSLNNVGDNECTPAPGG